jgi:ATP-dependent Zn protease
MPHSPEQITACHEAGHAVVALALGRAVQRVSILPDETRLGACEIRKGAVKPSDDDLETAMLVFLGGLAAEARLTGVYGWGGASQDLREVMSMCLGRAGNEKRAEKLAGRMLSKAEHVLNQPGMWEATQLIAAELVRRTTISGRAARHLFDEAQRQADRN